MSKIHANNVFQKQILANVLFDVYQKIAETVSCISCIWQFFYAQPVVRIVLFFYVMLSCTAWLHKSLHQNVILGQNTLRQNKVKI